MGRNYSIKSNPAVTDQCLIWDVENSDWRLSTIQTILDLYSPTGIQEANTQYYAPAATGFSIQVNDDNEDTHLILIPTGTMADGEIVLPAKANLRDKQTILVTTTQEITALALDGNGVATFYGEPTTLPAEGHFTLKYDLALDAWFRVG